jgi:hypothetical protein
MIWLVENDLVQFISSIALSFIITTAFLNMSHPVPLPRLQEARRKGLHFEKVIRRPLFGEMI